MTTTQIVAANLVLAVGALLQGAIGFGLALFAAPLLALIATGLAPGPLLVANVTLTFLMARREWKAVRLPEVGWMLFGRIFGIGIALWIMGRVSGADMDLLFGIVILVGVAMSSAGLSLQHNRRTLIGAGVVSGVMGTSTAVGGPPIAIAYQNQSGPEIRGTLSAYFTIGAVLSAAGLAATGKFGWPELRTGLLLCPGVIGGYLASGRLAPILDRRGLRPIILGFSAVSAIALILRRIF